MGIVAKYKYDVSVHADLIPEFNAEFTDYTITDEVDSENSNHIIRTIESDSLPTLIKFGNATETPNSRSLLTVEYLDTSECTTLEYLCAWCVNLSEFNCNLDTGKAKGAYSCFHACYNLSVLNVNSWDTTNFTGYGVFGIFAYCEKLSELDLSNWILDDCAIFARLFEDNKSLTRLDISNLNLNNATNVTSMFGGNIDNLTDIGMIYCDQSTINKVASLLPTNHNITIWVESDDILQYDQYDHITYKTQKVQDTVHLNSPLLRGDTIEVVDGKTYHVHRWEKIVLNGSENWARYENGDITSAFYLRTLKGKLAVGINLYCDKFISRFGSWVVNNRKEGIQVDEDIALVIQIDNSKLSTTNVSGFKQWLSENPTTAVCQLATPYYELISEEPLELTLLDTTDNTINNNSILPSNMTIANKELSTIAIKPSTTYTLSFDKSNVDSEVTIDICGGEQITTVLNRIELTTPSELGSGIRFISSDGCIISNVRLLEGSLVKEAIPKETFEGLKSSFEDGYIIGENLVPIGVNYQSDVISKATQLKKTIPAGTTITIIIHTKQACKSCVRACLQLQDKDGAGSQISYVGAVNNADFAINTGYHMSTVRTLTHDLSYINVWFNQVEGIVEYDEIYILEGDHTHLSEAELMRYIEKGTSHYEEEDYNHAGKYKVEYKVTGKNKYPTDSIDNPDLLWESSGGGTAPILYNSDEQAFYTEGHRQRCFYNLKPNTPYTVSVDIKCDERNSNYYDFLFQNHAENISYPEGLTTEWTRHFITRTTDETGYLNWVAYRYCYWKNIQIEEGTVATEYEPYKEDIRTYYLSSPLLKGDTIEDINGKATHVKRRWIEKLDGTRDYTNATNLGSVTRYQCGLPTNKYNGSNTASIAFPQFPKWHQGYEENWEHHYIWNNQIYIFLKNEKLVGGIKQWLSKNPTTLIYELASPIYEPISTESILCDSYTNGHLDLSNENIPIQKTEFRNFVKELAYLQPSTDYVVKFSSDNIGTAKVYLDSSVKEINVVKGINEVIITTPSTIVNNNIIIDGIGFNVSDVQVIANAIKDGDIKDFDYFKGLQSSFENGLVTDENDENYGKYKVECKIVGKNKWHLGDLYFDAKTIKSDGVTPLFKKGVYTLFCNASIEGASIRFMDNSDKEISWVLFGGDITFTLKEDIYAILLYSTNWSADLSRGKFVTINNIQIEEGTQATSYEPYKESIHTLYLNSPLLKGDKLVVHDGKLCHYHKMGMVMLDGSEDWVRETWDSILRFKLAEGAPKCLGGRWSKNYSNLYIQLHGDQSGIEYFRLDNSVNTHVLFVYKTNLNLTLDEFKKSLQANPTTVVYELAEPYYEPIEPQLSQYSFSTVKEGDMDIITVLPIEKINLTYRTDINGVSSIEEQIASIQEGTDISSIIDEEVDE